jgi:hypothetical protein
MLQTEVKYVKKTDPETGRQVSEEIPFNPYLWLTENDANIYFQDGEFYTGKGESPIKYEEVPSWFWTNLKKSYSLQAIAKLGIVLPENRVKTRDEKAAERAEALWECDECGEMVKSNVKGLHIANHKKNAKAKAKKEKGGK